jgi:quercetin dioxygenase-like cupin family protein
LILALHRGSAGAGAPGPNTVEDERTGLRWTLGPTAESGAVLAREVQLDPALQWLMRHDRVDFEPGGIAHRHTHPGPGIRCLLHGEITIDSEGERRTYGPGEAWFESGPEPVLATTSASEPTAFARVLLLPAEYAGQRTIRYVDPADADRPRLQKATILSERPVVL